MEEETLLEESLENKQPIGVEDAKEDEQDEAVGSIASYVKKQWRRSRDERQSDEKRWLKAYKNFRGVYSEDTRFTKTEKSKVFVKITKSKVLASFSHINEVIFGENKIPVRLQPTPVPEGIDEAVHFTIKTPETPGLPELKPGATHEDFELGYEEEKLETVKDRLEPGVGTKPGDITVHPAREAASRANLKMQDAFVESGLRKKIRQLIFELCLLGHGMLKGPLGVNREYPNWVSSEDSESNVGVYQPEFKFIPSFDHVSIWNYYPDPDADGIEDSEFGIVRHKMSRSGLRKLKKRPHFRKSVISKVIDMGPDYQQEWWEQSLDDNQVVPDINRFEVLEYWGIVDRQDLEEEDVDIPDELKDEEEISVNVWVAGGEVIRLILNPYEPNYLPFYSVPYEENPYSFFGVGVAENMDDTQLLMNGFMRLAVDNAVLSGNLVFELSEENLADGQDLEIYPGKVFVRQDGAPGQALFGTKFPNTANENIQLFDKARQLSDEQTGIPSFSHGQTGVTGIGRTSSGISMLLGAASGAIKNVVKNLDEHLFVPLGENTYAFLMQFEFDEDMKGDLVVKAQGTEAYTANEVRSQRLMQFLQLTQQDPFAKREYMLREVAKSLELDPDEVVNNPADAAIYAEILASLQTQMAPEGEGAPSLPGPQDTQGTGGGNIGIGQSPTPGEQGFTGTNQISNADLATQVPNEVQP